MLKNKKLFAVLLITLILLVFSVSSCFADTTPIPPPNEHEYYVVWYVDDIYYAIVSQNKCTYQDYGDNENFWLDGDKKFYIYNGSSWENGSIPNSYYGSSYVVFQYRQNYGLTFASTIYASNYDIVFTADRGKVFFHKAPVGVLAQKLEGVEMSQVMKELVGLVPLVIGLLVSVIGLRKALQILFQVLKNS